MQYDRGGNLTSDGQTFSYHATTQQRLATDGTTTATQRYHGHRLHSNKADPYEGSYNLTNPQSFNRYSYTRNDPVNSIDPSGLCSFNIGVAGGNNLSAEQLDAMKNEISRIYGTAGLGINFVTGGADYT